MLMKEHNTSMENLAISCTQAMINTCEYCIANEMKYSSRIFARQIRLDESLFSSWDLRRSIPFWWKSERSSLSEWLNEHIIVFIVEIFWNESIQIPRCTCNNANLRTSRNPLFLFHALLPKIACLLFFSFCPDDFFPLRRPRVNWLSWPKCWLVLKH